MLYVRNAFAMKKVFAIVVLIGISILGYQLQVSPSTDTPARQLELRDGSFWNVSDAILNALEQEDYDILSEHVHPVKGVRFSPYSYVFADSAVVLLPDTLRSSSTDNRIYTWGYYDGRGDDILLTVVDYFKRFVWDHDFRDASEVKYNQSSPSGNTINNLREVYPDNVFVEYYFDGFDPEFDGMDYASLTLVFDVFEGEFKLVGFIHGEWTI
jgi:hypothetical protein